MAVVDGYPEAIPQEGWLVNMHVVPDGPGVIDIVRYGAGALKISGPSDYRQWLGTASVYALARPCGRHIVAYEQTPSDVAPYDRVSSATYTGLSFAETDLIGLRNGGRLLDEKEPMQVHGGGISRRLDYEDLNRSSDHRSIATINRVTGDRTGLDQILAQVGYSMGLSREDIATLVATVGSKIDSGEAAPADVSRRAAEVAT